VFRIVRAVGRDLDRLEPHSRTVIADGFPLASEAFDAAVRWLGRYFPDANYQPECGRWWVADDDAVFVFQLEIATPIATSAPRIEPGLTGSAASSSGSV